MHSLPIIEPREEFSVVDEIADNLSLLLFLLEYNGESGDISSLSSRFLSFLFWLFRLAELMQCDEFAS